MDPYSSRCSSTIHGSRAAEQHIAGNSWPSLPVMLLASANAAGLPAWHGRRALGGGSAACRFTWDVIRKNRAGRVIVLTTHSMEEADLLADQIAIMAAGRIVAEGTSADLKSRYGVGYTLTMAKQRPDLSSSGCAHLMLTHAALELPGRAGEDACFSEMLLCFRALADVQLHGNEAVELGQCC